jgi:hypothetical protein
MLSIFPPPPCCGSACSPATASILITINCEESLPPLSTQARTNGVRLRFAGNPEQKFTIERAPTLAGPWAPIAVRFAAANNVIEYGETKDMSPMADDLKAAGSACWNTVYRRLEQVEAGLDIATAGPTSHLAIEHHLHLSRVLVLGHSAWGDLAMWVAARHRLTVGGELYTENPLPVRAVIDLAGTGDMEAFIPFKEQSCQGTVV